MCGMLPAPTIKHRTKLQEGQSERLFLIRGKGRFHNGSWGSSYTIAFAERCAKHCAAGGSVICMSGRGGGSLQGAVVAFQVLQASLQGSVLRCEAAHILIELPVALLGVLQLR